MKIPMDLRLTNLQKKKCRRQVCFISALPAANFRNEVGISSGEDNRLSGSDPTKLVSYYDNVCIVI